MKGKSISVTTPVEDEACRQKFNEVKTVSKDLEKDFLFKLFTSDKLN